MRSYLLILSAAAPFFLFSMLSPTGNAQERGAPNLAANLDLPIEAGGQDEMEDEDAPEIVVFYGQLYEANGVFFCCDVSGSMDGAPLKRLQQEVIRNIRQFSEKAEFGIVLFNSTVHKFPESGRPARATREMKAAAEQWVLSIAAGGGSCYKGALVSALTYANQSTARSKVIITLGDGMGGPRNCCPGFDAAPYKEETLTTVSKRNLNKVNINAICLGGVQEVDEAWMQRLAQENSGLYARIVQ